MKTFTKIALCVTASLFLLASQATATTMINDLNILYGMGAATVDLSSAGAAVDSVADPFGGTISFSSTMTHTQVGAGWATWPSTYGDPYAPPLDVLYTLGTEVKLSFDPNAITDFGFELEPTRFAVFEMMLTLDDGSTLTQLVDGFYGALAFGFTGGHVESLLITDVSGAAGGFAIGRLTMTQPVPEPATLLLLGSGLIGMFGFKKRKKNNS